MQQNIKPLPNHRVGVREVMLDEHFQVTDVISATRVSYTPDLITTYQRPDASGFIARGTVVGDEVKLELYRYIPQHHMATKVTESEGLAVEVFGRMDAVLIKWLLDAKDTHLSNLLPAGYGWDGIMTKSEYSKLRQIRDLFIGTNDWSKADNEWFQETLQQATKTNQRFLTYTWEEASVLGLNVNVERYMDECAVDVITFDKEGVRTRHRVRRRIGDVKTNVQETYNISKDIQRVIVVRSGCMIDDSLTPYGCSIELYERRGKL